MSVYKERVQGLHEVLESEKIDLQLLRRLCFQGIPDDSGFRPICWRLLLGYLPANTLDWPQVLKKQRALYNQFLEDMVISHDCGSPEGLPDDHPLNCNPNSKWQVFFKDNDVLLQIDKDVRRLCPDMCFFQRATDYPCERITQDPGVQSLRERVQRTMLHSANVTRSRMGITNISLNAGRPAQYERLPQGQEAHWEVVERILFLYAKLNPGLGYVQGMNEIIGPIYYTFAADPNPEWKKHAEADCFFCFTSLMAEIRDFFLKTLDDSACGIGAMMQRLMGLLKRRDDRLHLRLRQLQVEPQYYTCASCRRSRSTTASAGSCSCCPRTSLYQSTPIPVLFFNQACGVPIQEARARDCRDVLRIWDSLFADPERFGFLIYICYAMLARLRDRLMSGDFPSNIKLLQNFPDTDVNELLAEALRVQEEDRLQG
ncbi:hypothetical protein HPB47_004349 [Ixodes persulcatus]|uniref:Uncharacterized protein n=1 Tax=Ixodes persulcatus TaxID=34615 RepID=A0AC60PG55_IXOPE|nr:hypothetical protein HPB47_004349 [Ixodes persulcatus]